MALDGSPYALPVEHKSFDRDPMDVDIDVDALVAELDAEPREGAVQRPARDTLADLDAEPDWARLYDELYWPDSMCVGAIWLTGTRFEPGGPYHRFVATLTATYEPTVADHAPRSVVGSQYDMADRALDKAWPEVNLHDVHLDETTVSVSVGIDVPFDEDHLGWLEPRDRVDDPADPEFGLPETHATDGEFTVGLLPQSASDDIRESVSVERVEATIETPLGVATGARMRLDTVEFYLGGIDEKCVVDRVAIGDHHAAGGSKLVTYAIFELEAPHDARDLNTLAVSDIEVEVS